MQRTQVFFPLHSNACYYWRFIHRLMGVDSPVSAIESAILLCAAIVQHADTEGVLTLKRDDTLRSINLKADIDKEFKNFEARASYSPSDMRAQMSMKRFNVGLGKYTKRACESRLAAAFGTQCLETIVKKSMALTEEILAFRQEDKTITIQKRDGSELRYNTFGRQPTEPMPMSDKSVQRFFRRSFGSATP